MNEITHAKLDMIAEDMEVAIVRLDRIAKSLTSREKFLDDRLCELIGQAMSVHNSLVMTLRVSSVDQERQLLSQLEASRDLLEQREVDKVVKRYLDGGEKAI